MMCIPIDYTQESTPKCFSYEGDSQGTLWPQLTGVACGFGLESDPPSSGSFCNWEGLVVFGKSNSLTVHPMTMKALLKKIISFSPFKNYIYFDLFI